MEPTGPPRPEATPPDPLRLVPRPRSPADRSVRRRAGVVAAGAAAVLVLAGTAPATAAGPGLPQGPVGPTSATAAAPTVCLVVGRSRAGRAWLPRARVLVPGAQVLAARALSPGARARAGAGLVEVQRTTRHGAAAGAPVVVEVVVLETSGRGGPTRRVCELPDGLSVAPAQAPSAPAAHGVRRLVRAD